MGAIAPKLRGQPAERHRPLVRGEEAGIDIARRADAERPQHQVRDGQALEGTEIRRTLGGRLLEAGEGAFEPLTRAPIPEVPSFPHQRIRGRHVNRVADLGPVDNPRAVLAERFPDLADGHVHGVTRDERPFPRLLDHLLVAQ